MATVATIAALLMQALQTLPDIDQASIDHYLPPVTTQKIAVVIPPLDQKTRSQAPTAGRGPRLYWYQIRCEFWVKLNAGDIPTGVARVREIGRQAIDVLWTDRRLNDGGLRVGWIGPGDGQGIQADVGERPLNVGGVDYLVATVYAPIVDYGA